MDIERTLNGSAAVLKICGRLDTTTAPELENAVNACIEGLTELVLDMNALEYISSAGLRVILAAQKRMKSQGTMKIIGASENLMDIFDITGFTDILTIERA